MISEEKLTVRWSAPSETEMARIKSTKDQIEGLLKRHLNIDEIKKNYNLSNFDYDVYLQWSYANSTNISFSSDVDIVIEFKSEYYYSIDHLTVLDKDVFAKSLSWRGSDYDFWKFKNDIYQLLDEYFDNVEYKSKCIKVPWNTNRVDADLVPCFTFKNYLSFSQYWLSRINQWIKFWDTKTHIGIVNYPKIHKENCTTKNKETNENYKASVRIFKNFNRELINSWLIDEKVAPSYFIENLIYNVPNNYFTWNYSNCISNIFLYLLRDMKDWNSFLCANNVDKLFSDKSWNIANAKMFLWEALDLFTEK